MREKIRDLIISAIAETDKLTDVIDELTDLIEFEPEYNSQAEGCGLEDRSITDRYEAMAYGWERAMDKIKEEQLLFTK